MCAARACAVPAEPKLPFESILKELVSNVEGARGAIFLERDGEAVRWYSIQDGEQLRLRAAYLAVLVHTWRGSAGRLNLGQTKMFIVEYEGARFVIQDLLHGYFVALELESAANLAQAISRLQPAVRDLRQEINA
jgi:predicted regulator of Ras-like GTPase activity (Roadblock/LC7/MglB family)